MACEDIKQRLAGLRTEKSDVEANLGNLQGPGLKAAREGRELPNGSVLLGEFYSAKLGPDKTPVAGPDGRFVPDQLVRNARRSSRRGLPRLPDFPLAPQRAAASRASRTTSDIGRTL